MDRASAAALNEAVRTVAIRHRALAGALLAPLGLHAGQEVILFQLAERGALSQGELAVGSGCEPPTITHSVRKLEAAGLVVRRPSPTDGRVVLVELSERGRELTPRMQQAWRELAERSVAGLRETSVEELTEALVDLAESLTSATAALRADTAGRVTEAG